MGARHVITDLQGATQESTNNR